MRAAWWWSAESTKQTAESPHKLPYWDTRASESSHYSEENWRQRTLVDVPASAVHPPFLEVTPKETDARQRRNRQLGLLRWNLSAPPRFEALSPAPV